MSFCKSVSSIQQINLHCSNLFFHRLHNLCVDLYNFHILEDCRSSAVFCPHCMVFHHLQVQDLSKSGFPRKYQSHIKPVQKNNKKFNKHFGNNKFVKYQKILEIFFRTSEAVIRRCSSK